MTTTKDRQDTFTEKLAELDDARKLTDSAEEAALRAAYAAIYSYSPQFTAEACAAKLGMSRSTMYARFKLLGLTGRNRYPYR